MKRPFVPCLVPAFLVIATLPAVAQNQNWIRQFGTGGHDLASGAASDGAGGVQASGGTYGSLFGPSAGGADV